MIKRLTKENISDLKNNLLKKDADRYIKIYDNFLNDIKSSGIKISEIDNSILRDKNIQNLISNGATVSNNGNSISINNISPSCIDCRKGINSITYILTLKCNRDCYFCTNKNQYNYKETLNNVNNILDDFIKDFKHNKQLSSVAITGGEPLLYPDKCYEFFNTVKNYSKNIHTRLYTNGDLATETILSNLAKSGLDEIRFGIKIDNNKIDEKIFDTIKIAKKYIKRVMVEMPIIKNELSIMKDTLIKLDEIGIFGINILEFLYPYINPDEYTNNDYIIKKQPYTILYDYNYAGGIPIYGSDEASLELLKFAQDKRLKISLHYCNLENKLSAQIYQQNHRIKLSPHEIFSQNDFFIKSVRGYGITDIKEIKQKLDNANINHYYYNESDEFIEFSPEHVHILKEMDIELGLLYMIQDFDEMGRGVIRELKIDLIRPVDFKLDEI